MARRMVTTVHLVLEWDEDSYRTPLDEDWEWFFNGKHGDDLNLIDIVSETVTTSPKEK